MIFTYLFVFFGGLSPSGKGLMLSAHPSVSVPTERPLSDSISLSLSSLSALLNTKISASAEIF